MSLKSFRVGFGLLFIFGILALHAYSETASAQKCKDPRLALRYMTQRCMGCVSKCRGWCLLKRLPFYTICNPKSVDNITPCLCCCGTNKPTSPPPPPPSPPPPPPSPPPPSPPPPPPSPPPPSPPPPPPSPPPPSPPPSPPPPSPPPPPPSPPPPSPPPPPPSPPPPSPPPSPPPPSPPPPSAPVGFCSAGQTSVSSPMTDCSLCTRAYCGTKCPGGQTSVKKVGGCNVISKACRCCCESSTLSSSTAALVSLFFTEAL